MTFKDLEDWQKKLMVKDLKDGENIYIEYTKDDIIAGLKKENQELKRQLEYLRNGEYLNQLKFERNVLKDVVNKGEVSEEDKQFIDCTHRNTELLAQQKEFIEWLENESKELIRDAGYHQRICLEILDKYKEIIGGDNK